MTKEEISRIALPHLRSQFERGFPILFTGAGFSLAAKNIVRGPLPSPGELKKELWAVAFPGVEFDETSSLQDVYASAVRSQRNQLIERFRQLLTVDAERLPDWYRVVFSLPWARCYTLNVDDLAHAVARRFPLPRTIAAISATHQGSAPGGSVSPTALQIVHLNGSLQDLPDDVTFSTIQYAERLARPEPWYVRLTADLISHPIVFIGTRLDEPPLWQHIELRRTRGARGTRELRPRSYLITPTLDRARQGLLAEFNVEWIPMTAEEFAKEVLSELGDAATAGLNVVLAGRPDGQTSETIPDVATLATANPGERTEFLLGQEPRWSDLQSGRAIERDIDREIWTAVETTLRAHAMRGVIVFTGTAGSGKSTSLMRVCLRLVAQGVETTWIDRDSGLSTHQIRAALRSADDVEVLAIDDADLLGIDLAPSIREICRGTHNPLVLIAIRSTRLDRFLAPTILAGVPVEQVTMPHLTDSDIAGLLQVLDRENRLGILKGKKRSEQEELFRREAGRQLLVAMIQATSGRRVEEKVMEELSGLEPEGRFVYSLVALSTYFRYGLTNEDILIGSGDQSNESLNVLSQLTARNVLIRVGDKVQARHRVIAEIIVDELQKNGQLTDVLMGLGRIAAVKVDPSTPRSSRPARLLR